MEVFGSSQKNPRLDSDQPNVVLDIVILTIVSWRVYDLLRMM